MSDKVRIIQYGLGLIGSAVARHVVERTGLELVGAIDIDPAKIGQDAGQVIGLEQSLGFGVAKNLRSVNIIAQEGTWRNMQAAALARNRYPMPGKFRTGAPQSTVRVLLRFRGKSGSIPRATLMW